MASLAVSCAVERAALADVIVDSFAMCARAEPVMPRRAASSVITALPSTRRRVGVSVGNGDTMALRRLVSQLLAVAEGR